MGKRDKDGNITKEGLFIQLLLTLNKEFDCILQIGGSDQWGNIIAGIEFGEKILPNKDFFGMTRIGFSEKT